MRRRLVWYFAHKKCLAADELADETLNRVSRRLEEEGAIVDTAPARYCYIVAKFVFLEYLRRTNLQQASLAEMSNPPGIDITVEAQKAAMTRVKTATHEHQVQATIEFTFRNLGACCWAFPSIVAAGRNATTLHYETNNDPIVRDGLLLTDLGAEVEGYSADVTRTYPADGTFSPEQRAVYDVVDIGVVAAREELQRLRDARRSVEQPLAARVFAKLGQQLPNQFVHVSILSSRESLAKLRDSVSHRDKAARKTGPQRPTARTAARKSSNSRALGWHDS